MSNLINMITDMPSNKPVPYMERDRDGREVMKYGALGKSHRKLFHSPEDAKMMGMATQSHEAFALSMLHQKVDNDPGMAFILEAKRKGIIGEEAKWLLLWRSLQGA